ncbi:MAG: hypothetical protein HYR51_07870 [Candidatus Rokubacteria bacterium]|nr:hypothetical protein [Candidatus Rokubacteria bacterium]
MKTRAALAWLLAAVVAHGVVTAGTAAAFDRTNIPLKNWGGFAIGRDALYDDLERLVTAGLADRTLLNTKPLSRVEAARIVARAIETIRADTDGKWDDRRDLESVLDRLRIELRPELASLGVRTNGDPKPGFFSFTPVDRAQVRGAYATRDRSIVNEQGLRFQDGWNGGTTFESRAQIGDFLTFYLQPEGQLNEEFGALRLASGYAKLTLWNVELLVGRDSLWWGPGLHGSLIMSNNAPPLDQVRIGSAEPFLLPWVGEYVGPMKLLFFIAELEERRDFPRAKLSGMRATVSPFSFLELGVSRAVMFGGDTRPRLDLEDYPRVLVQPEAGDITTAERFRNNNLFAIDGELRLRNVHRYHLPARDLRLYGEFGWDDTCCQTNIVPLRRAISGLVGVHLLGMFGHDIDVRAEYTRTSELSYNHRQFRSGYWTRGEVISHFAGTEGDDWFARVVNRLTPNVMLGLELNRATIGRTVLGFTGPKERRVGGAMDLSWNVTDKYAAFWRYQIADVDNRDFQRGANGVDHVVRLEITRSFQ